MGIGAHSGAQSGDAGRRPSPAESALDPIATVPGACLQRRPHLDEEIHALGEPRRAGEHPHDEHVLRGSLQLIVLLQAQIREVEQQITEAATLPCFQAAVQILQGFRGIALYTAMQLVCERGAFRRFQRPTALMAYVGLVSAQHSSGTTLRYGSITKTGNVHARKALVSAAWKYTYSPRVSVALQQRQQHCSARTIAISQRAQQRVHKRYLALKRRKAPKVAVTAIARELAAFLWEAMQPQPAA